MAAEKKQKSSERKEKSGKEIQGEKKADPGRRKLYPSTKRKKRKSSGLKQYRQKMRTEEKKKLIDDYLLRMGVYAISVNNK